MVPCLDPNSWPTALVAEQSHVFLFYALFKVFVLANRETIFLHVPRIVVGYIIGQIVPLLSVQNTEVPIERRLASTCGADKLPSLEKDGWRHATAPAVSGWNCREEDADLVHHGPKMVKIVRHLTGNLEIQFIDWLDPLVGTVPKTNSV